MAQKSSLEKLFGSSAKVRVLQTFMASPNAFFSPKDIAKRTNMSVSLVKKNILDLKKAGVLEVKKNAKNKRKKGHKS